MHWDLDWLEGRGWSGTFVAERAFLERLEHFISHVYLKRCIGSHN